MQLLDAEDPALVPFPRSCQEGKGASVRATSCISASEMYVARKKKRMEEAEIEILSKPRSWQEERLVGLKAEFARAASAPLPVPTDVGVCDEIARLKARLAAAEEERDAALRSKSSKRQATMLRTSGVRTRTDHIPPKPSLVPEELSQWLLDRHSNL